MSGEGPTWRARKSVTLKNAWLSEVVTGMSPPSVLLAFFRCAADAVIASSAARCAGKEPCATGQQEACRRLGHRGEGHVVNGEVPEIVVGGLNGDRGDPAARERE